MIAAATTSETNHMAELDLTGEISAGLTGAALRGRTVVVAYVTPGDPPAPGLGYRGSVIVYGPQQLALWARNADDGLAVAVGKNPNVSLVFYEADGPGPRYLNIRGRAKVDPSANDRVYAEMIEGERNADADKKGVAIVIDVDRVQGFGADGGFTMERAG
jgi:hypothetical protein